MIVHNQKDEGLKNLQEKIQDIEIAMMTTISREGYLHSRPMKTLEMTEQGKLLFLVTMDSPKVDELTEDNRVSLSFGNADEHCYVSISGLVQIDRDQKKIQQLWKPEFSKWVDDGLENPDLAILKVLITHAEYWDITSSTIQLLFSQFTDKEVYEHQKLAYR